MPRNYLKTFGVWERGLQGFDPGHWNMENGWAWPWDAMGPCPQIHCNIGWWLYRVCWVLSTRLPGDPGDPIGVHRGSRGKKAYKRHKKATSTRLTNVHFARISYHRCWLLISQKQWIDCTSFGPNDRTERDDPRSGHVQFFFNAHPPTQTSQILLVLERCVCHMTHMLMQLWEMQIIANPLFECDAWGTPTLAYFGWDIPHHSVFQKTWSQSRPERRQKRAAMCSSSTVLLGDST